MKRLLIAMLVALGLLAGCVVHGGVYEPYPYGYWYEPGPTIVVPGPPIYYRGHNHDRGFHGGHGGHHR